MIYHNTPGPWKVMYSTDRIGQCCLAVWPESTAEGDVASPICKVSPEATETEADRIHAALISGAPYMLGTLHQILLLAEDNSTPDPAEMAAIANWCKQAIAKTNVTEKEVSNG